MPIPALTESTIRSNSTVQSFQRGESYYNAGAVVSLIQRGNILYGEVEGSEVHPYQVTLTFDEGGLTSESCTCPYSFGGWCKHIVATALTCIHQPETLEERPTLEQLLDRLNPLQTQRLVQALVKLQPDLLRTIDQQINLITASSTPLTNSASKSASKSVSKPVRQTTVDPKPFLYEARQILRKAVRAWEEGVEEDFLTEDFLTLIEKAQAFIDLDDGNNALVALEGITTGCAQNWDEVANYTGDDEILDVLDSAWSEAILSAELTPEQEADLWSKFLGWRDQLGNTFELSLAALKQGWNHPHLQQILEGNLADADTDKNENEDIFSSQTLTEIRLKILDRQNRHQEHLYLAEAAGETQAYLTMLARLGRIEEAVTKAATQITTVTEAFALAQTLREQGYLTQALGIAKQGLVLIESKDPKAFMACNLTSLYEFALWTGKLAEGLGDLITAKAARITAFRAKPDLGDYQKLQELAGDRWSALKPDLLAMLRTHSEWYLRQTKVDIFLHEGLIDEAIAIVTELRSFDDRLIQQVMDVTISERPDWVIANACERAESIMNSGKAHYYSYAIDWLRRVKAAYLATDRPSEWSQYRSKLLNIHARKRKLMNLFKTIP